MMTTTDKQIEAVARSMMRTVFQDESVAETSDLDWTGSDVWGCDFAEMAKAAIEASHEQYKPLVEALKSIAYRPLGGDTATYLCGVNMQNTAKQALANIPAELRK